MIGGMVLMKLVLELINYLNKLLRKKGSFNLVRLASSDIDGPHVDLLFLADLASSDTS